MDWKKSVNIADLHSAYQLGELSPQQLALAVHERLKKLPYYSQDEYEYEEIVDWFKDMSEDENSDIEDYDSILAELYDWADTDKRLWVDTFA